ncbi:LLM class flavin-dependent oxidoreductase [Dinghuibacter silviterrae]|uniref:Luciferase-like monooxygenase n=1 Tax=Dinghuibacter silviterrae TaxID=1539049 RepID=A0A4R8DVN8_9BACT|nr:LLM class flavin-dependent oxidoreductase [Dinghuibacter silviterrae]TDX02106.1 luciferase family oxidoreductase group 1 [Dinghuibacter silviterrae]
MNRFPLSVLELAIVGQGGDAGTAIAGTAAVARHVESLGYTRIWMAEHHNMQHVASSATAVLIGHVAGQTQHIRVGSGGIMLPNHAPLVVAEQFGTLETLYPGRIDLGLGRAPGTDQVTAMALRRNNMSAAYHFAEDIRDLQTYFSADNADGRVHAFPGEGLTIPIWILGSSTDSAHLAAQMGLPYAFAAHFAPAQLWAAIDIYRREFKPSAQLQKPYMMACVNVMAADTDEEAEWLSSSLYRMFLGIITNERRPLQPPAALPDILKVPEVYNAVQAMTACTFTGNKESLGTKLSAFIKESRVDELMISSPIYDQEAKRKSFSILREAI